MVLEREGGHVQIKRRLQYRPPEGLGDDSAPMPVAPVAYQVILEPGIGQFREFESPRVHTRINSSGLFLVHKLTRGKHESMS